MDVGLKKRIMGAIKGALAAVLVGHMLSVQGCSKPDALDRIVDAGAIIALTRDAVHTHYTYQNQQAGYEYDLARAFANHLGVTLRVRSAAPDTLMSMLGNGQGDFISAGYRVTSARRNQAAFSTPYSQSVIHIVAHRGNRTIRSSEDLAGRTVYVRQGSAEEEALRALRGTTPHFKIASREKSVEELLGMVENEQIELTACDARSAGLYRRYHPAIQARFPVSAPLPIAWAIPPGNPALMDAMNRFLAKAKDDGTLKAIHNRHFGNGFKHEYLDLRRFHSRVKTRLPRYEKIVRDVALDKDIDWRLVAAIMYQESHYDPYAVSYTGVRGLMQVTQVTATEMGIEDRQDPQQSVEAGVQYLIKLMGMFPEVGDQDRLPLALASYNVGYGHVRDAMVIAREKGLNPLLWPSVEECLPLLRKWKFYSQAKHGYCRGSEPVQYVNNVMTYYDILKRKAVVLRS